jgi:hypothetical protein
MTPRRFPPPWSVEEDLWLCRASRRIRGHATLQEVRRIGNKGGGSAIMFAGRRLQPKRGRCPSLETGAFDAIFFHDTRTGPGRG